MQSKEEIILEVFREHSFDAAIFGGSAIVIPEDEWCRVVEQILSLLHPKQDTPPQLNKHDVMRWVDTNVQMPDFDGMYLAFIYQKQLCGTVWKYQKVVHNRMNAWVLDESEELKYWSELPPPPIV